MFPRHFNDGFVIPAKAGIHIVIASVPVLSGVDGARQSQKNSLDLISVFDNYMVRLMDGPRLLKI